jgi:HTH-type transcriptional repressor of NAD biosynthesis genes
VIKGLIVGKFWPPHAGHHHLVRTGAAAVDVLVVVVGDSATEDIPWELRVAWLREVHPGIHVERIEDAWPEDPVGWAGACVARFGAFDRVFTSEDYGLRFAECLTAAGGRPCQHVSVDRTRGAFPVSGTTVRADPLGSWAFLSPPVRAYFTRRVVIVGAESTGKTTLARRLADHLGVGWVPEYGREYCEQIVASGVTFEGYAWRSDEFDHIGAEQARREELAAREGRGLVICDTDPFATALWHHHYVGQPHPGLLRWTTPSRWRRVYLLCSPDVPFVQDGVRDGEHRRVEMTHRFIAAMNARGDRYEVLTGGWEERFARAVQVVGGE